MSEFIPLSVPSIQGNEWQYVKECIDTEWVSSAGKYVNQFEEHFAEKVGAKHAIACMNGTAALQVAMQVAGVQPGDEVLCPTVTFMATVNAVHYLQASPVFLDCDAFYNIDGHKVARYITEQTTFRDGYTYNNVTGKRITAIMPVHVFGNAVDFEPFYDLCLERNIAIVEDAAESVGTSYTAGKFAGKHTGTIGKISGFSFNGNKIMTTGGGGMIVTDDDALANKARYLTTQAKDDEVRYIHHEVGYNFRMTNIQAALGVAQLEQLPGFLATKKANYQYYKERLQDIAGLTLAPVPDYADNNHWLYALRIDSQVYGRDREQLMAFLQEHSIQSRPLWYLNHLQRPYAHCESYSIEMAPAIYEETLNIPSSTNLTLAQIDRIIATLKL